MGDLGLYIARRIHQMSADHLLSLDSEVVQLVMQIADDLLNPRICWRCGEDIGGETPSNHEVCDLVEQEIWRGAPTIEARLEPYRV